jgi:hypothetical protein
MSYDNISQPWQASKRSVTKRIPKQANSSWRYIHHPTSWSLEYVQDGKKKEKKPIWLPKFSRLILKPGVNGVSGTEDNPDTRLARLQVTDNGCTIIDPERYDYLRVYPAIGGELTVNKWTKIENLGGRVFMVGDDQAFAEFRRELVADGAIQLPHEQVLFGLMMKQQEIITMHSSKPHIPQAVKDQTKAEQKLADMNKATEAAKKQGVKYYES